MFKKKETLTSDAPTTLKQVDVESISTDGHSLRAQSREDSFQEWIADFDVTGLKTALRGYNKRDVEYMVTDTRDKMKQLVGVIDDLKAENTELNAIKMTDLRTGVTQDTIPPESDMAAADTAHMKLAMENEDLKIEIEKLKSEARSDSERLNQKLDDLTIKYAKATQELATLKNQSPVNSDVELELKAQLEAMETETQALLNQVVELQESIAAKDAEIESVKNNTKAEVEQSYSQIGKVIAEAKAQSEKQLTEAKSKASKILLDAEKSAEETRTEAGEFYKQRVLEAQNLAMEIVEKANNDIDKMFQSTNAARNDVILGHKLIAERARSNQNHILELMKAQKEALQEQANLATSPDLDAVINGAQTQIENAETLLISRQMAAKQDLGKIALRLTSASTNTTN